MVNGWIRYSKAIRKGSDNEIGKQIQKIITKYFRLMVISKQPIKSILYLENEQTPSQQPTYFDTVHWRMLMSRSPMN